MRIHGYCTSCRRFRQVGVSGHGMAMLAAAGVAEGVCADCEERADKPFELVVERAHRTVLRYPCRTLQAAVAEGARLGQGALSVAIEEHRPFHPFGLVRRFDARGRPKDDGRRPR